MLLRKTRSPGPAVLGTLLACLVAVAVPSAAQARCEAKIDGELRKAGVAASDVQRIDLRPRRGSLENGSQLDGYSAWVRLKSCAGAVIIDLSDYCYVEQVYTRDGCQVAGLPSSC